MEGAIRVADFGGGLEDGCAPGWCGSKLTAAAATRGVVLRRSLGKVFRDVYPLLRFTVFAGLKGGDES